MLKIDDADTCLSCGAYFQDTGYCANGHIRLQADIIRKYFEKIDEFTGPLGGHYSLWKNDQIAVAIHDDDDDVVSVLDIATNKYLYIDDKTVKGMNLIKDSEVKT